eukprot:gene9517-17256_t
MLTEFVKLLAMEEKERIVGLTDSSGSDGSLSKDLSKRAELNFSAPSLPLEDDQIDTGGDLEVVEENSHGEITNRGENKEITSDFDNQNTDSVDNLLSCEVDALMVCEKCHGPITKLKRYGNSGKQFCSKNCAQSQKMSQSVIDDDRDNDDNNDQYDGNSAVRQDSVIKATGGVVIEEPRRATNKAAPDKIDPVSKQTNEAETQAVSPCNWKEYQDEMLKSAAMLINFNKLSKPVKGLKPGMKLEALDKNNPCNYCVATVIEIVGHRVRIRYDGFGDNDSQDFWCNFQAEELYPIGWCAENSFPLQPPTGISSTLEDWKIFLTKTLTGALAAPMDLFRENENRTQAKVHSFQAGLKVEVIHPRRPSIICPATITKSLGPYLYQVTTEPLPNLPSHTFYGRGESTGIFSFGWSTKNSIDLALPSYVDSSGLTKEKYLAMCRKKSAPPTNSENRRVKNAFRVGEKLAAVDLEEPHLVRVATVFNIIGRVLLLLFDGQGKFQYVDCDSEDIYPVEWLLNTGHPLCTPNGTVRASKGDFATGVELTVDESGHRSTTVANDISTPTVREIVKDKTQEDPEKQDAYCVYFNKSCIIGPFLDPEKVAKMPATTATAKPPAAVRLALERLIAVAINPSETMDALQDGFCAKLFSRGKSKVLKKGLCRFDTKVRASRLLKRLCKKLKSCEYFLSFDPTKEPCPLDCRTSGATSLEGFTMRNMKTKEDLLKMASEDYRKKRGRPRKDEYDVKHDVSSMKGEFVLGNDNGVSKSVATTQVRVLNFASYNGRPLVPIAPGSKAPITIMPASSQVHHARPPPPYEIGSHSSFVHPVHSNTVITSATQSRMVTPVNVRMLPPGAQSSVVSGSDLSSPSLTSPNLATVLVVTKPPGTTHQGQGLLSLRGNVANQGVRLPLSPSSRKGQIQVLGGSSRSKAQGTIKIHGPMFDQAPGTMNPMAASSELKQVLSSSTRIENGVKFLQRGQALHIPSQSQSNPSQIYETDSNIASDFPVYRSGNLDSLSTNHGSRFGAIKPPIEIKMEPQDHHFQRSESSPVQQMSPTIHIHHPASSTYHHMSQDGIQDGTKSLLSDGVSMHIVDDEMDGSVHSNMSPNSPIKTNVSMKYDIVSHHGMKRHMPSSLPSHMKNHLKVATTNTGGSQSALSPLHSPPPLRPAPSGQHRSIALRSPPNLTPSTVISHFDFTPVTTTTSVISQSGRVIHHPSTPISSKTFSDAANGLANGQVVSREMGTLTADVLSPNISTPASNGTMTLTYIPVKTQPSDKIVYVPVSHSFSKDRQQQPLQHQQQPIFIYSKPGSHGERFQDGIPGGGHRSHHKIPISSLEEISHQPYSGVTRKFTVRTLQRDSNNGPLSSGLTTVRIQGSKLNTIRSNSSQSFQDVAYYTPKNTSPGNLSEKSSNYRVNENEIVARHRTIEALKHGTESTIQGDSRLDNEVSFYNSNNSSYGEISGDDDDDYDCNEDGDFGCEEFSDEVIESEVNASNGNQATHGQGLGMHARQRIKKRLLSRQKGIVSAQFKVKYKQALEQAKFLRERRPSFSSLQSQGRTTDIPEQASISREESCIYNLEASPVSKASYDCGTPAGCHPKVSDSDIHGQSGLLELRDEKFRANASGFGNYDAQASLGHESILERGLSPPSGNGSKHSQQDTGKIEMNGLKRKRLENEFVLDHWDASEDAKIRKKKKISTASANLTKYLTDPLDKVKLPGNPASWSEEDVASFLNATDCSEYAETLKDQEIDGSALLLLTRESLMEFAGMKLGPALKICGYVATLKGRIRMQQNIALIQG